MNRPTSYIMQPHVRFPVFTSVDVRCNHMNRPMIHVYAIGFYIENHER